ncbi:TIGR01459 family HAD-type hydrolase [Maricaulis sp. CAU 1757]
MTDYPTLGSLRSRYDALYCDVWGVIRDGAALLPEAVEALREWRRSGGAVCLVSNSPKPRSDLQAMLRQMGLPDDAVDAMVTSGDAIHAELAARTPGRAFRIGPQRDDPLYVGLDIEFTDIGQADFISCTGPDDEVNGHPEDYDSVLREALARKLDLVCANPDIVVQSGEGLVYCAGAIARHYRQMGGRSIVAGKPHRPIYELAARALAGIGRDTPLERVLAIGDGPETDIEGASRIGVDALFIADGILGAEMENASFDPDRVEEALSEYGVSARYAAPKLVW